MADKWVQRWEVASHSNPNRTYTVAIDAEGNWGCSCPAWTRHMPRKDCKHIRQVKAMEQAPKVATVPISQLGDTWTVPTEQPVPQPVPTPHPQRKRKPQPSTRLAYLEF